MNPHQTYNFHNMGSPPPPMSIHPGPASSPSQSVPGRRTPLGTVGLGGFYAQGHSGGGTTHVHTDENRPGGSSSTRYVIRLTILYCESKSNPIEYLDRQINRPFHQHLDRIKRKIVRGKPFD